MEAREVAGRVAVVRAAEARAAGRAAVGMAGVAMVEVAKEEAMVVAEMGMAHRHRQSKHVLGPGHLDHAAHIEEVKGAEVKGPRSDQEVAPSRRPP